MFLDTVSVVVSVCLTPSLLDLYLLAFRIIVMISESFALSRLANLSRISRDEMLSILACAIIIYAIDSADALLNPLLTKYAIVASYSAELN